jgi:hypothetical protein
VGRRRPWRAIAYVVDPTSPNGRRREVAGRTAAVKREGLDEFIKRHRRAGHPLDVYEVLAID